MPLDPHPPQQPENTSLLPQMPIPPAPGQPQQAAAAQNPAGQLPVVADNDPNSPRPSQYQQTSSQGDVEIQHAPGQHPQYGYQAQETLRPLSANQPYTNDQAYPPGPSSKDEADRYAFFLEENKKAKANLLGGLKGSGSSKLMKLVIFGGLFVVLLIISAVVITAVRDTGTKDTSGTLLTVVQDQQEIIRVSKLAEKTVQSTTLKNFIPTAETTMASSQNQLITYIRDRGGDVDPKVLGAYKQNARVDAALTAAQASGTYDPTFTDAMQEILTKYQSDSQSLYNTATGQNQRSLLEKNITAAELLLKMLTSNQ